MITTYFGGKKFIHSKDSVPIQTESETKSLNYYCLNFKDKEIDSYKVSILKDLNLYFEESMVGCRFKDFTPGDNCIKTINVFWIENLPHDHEYKHYNGAREGDNVYVLRPNTAHTPIILIHELLHVLDLQERTNLNFCKNIMNADNLFNNYMISLKQINIINNLPSGNSLVHSILPQSSRISMNLSPTGNFTETENNSDEIL